MEQFSHFSLNLFSLLHNYDDHILIHGCYLLFSFQHGTRHIIESMNKAGHSIETLVLCGGLTKNELFIQTHADVTGSRIIVRIANGLCTFFSYLLSTSWLWCH